MIVAISGASGLIGSALTSALKADGHTVVRLARRRSDAPDEIYFQPDSMEIDTERLADVDAVVNLAGEPIFGIRWTDAKRERVLQSRVRGTRLIAQALADLGDRKRTLVSASAVGYYGDAPTWVDEDSPVGSGFLSEVCAAWEDAAQPARDAGLRVVHPRIGLVLAPEGGALGQMLPAFKLGAGGPIGDGAQYFPWVAIEDVVGAIRLALSSQITGPINVVSPNIVTNAEFTEALGKALRRPTVFRLPKIAIRAALGDMGDELLLQGQRARPTRLIEAGYEFEYPELSAALAHILT